MLRAKALILKNLYQADELNLIIDLYTSFLQNAGKAA